MGNQKTQVVNVSKIDKTINNIMNVNQSMSMVNANNSTRRMTFTFNPVTDSISGIKGYSYVIDKNAGEIFMEMPIVTPDSSFESVDAIIVTPFLQYESIKEMLQKKINCPVLSIADIINNV